jgi:hypothetical protein
MKHSLIRIIIAAGIFACISSPDKASAKTLGPASVIQSPNPDETENFYFSSNIGAGAPDEEDAFTNANPADKDEDAKLQEMKAKKKKAKKKVKKKTTSHAS